MPPRKSSQDERMAASSLSVVHSGWVLKKKRKKMQGYAKRFLILTKEGLLTYALSPDKKVRDAIEIPHASVTSSKRHGTIHVDSGSSVFHLKMLSPTDFEEWRAQLRSFIPERDPGSAHRIYVASSGETDLVSVDLSGVFDGIATQGRLIEEVQKSVKAIEQKKLDKGMTESLLQMITPPTTIDGLLQKFSLTGDSSRDSPFAALAILVDQLAAEHANLKHAIETKVPRVSGPDGSMDSIKSRLGGNSRSRMSFSSFHTSEEPSFYDADAAEGEDFVLDDSRTIGKGEESSGAEESDDDDSGAEDDGKPIKGGGKPTPSASDSSSSVQYRKELPAKVSGDEVSLFSMLKKNVGKDLSTISFPVSFNCPLSLLQATCEEFEYAPELLEKAAKSQDWVERICLVGAFAVSGYASTKLRASRKPFNPMLGETFECVREDKHLKFIAEKVVHQPPIVASYAEGKGWSCSSQSSVKNKFWGKSLELIPEGSTRLEFNDGDVFSFQKPSSFMRNLLAGNKYLEHVGELTVTNENTGARLVIEFKEGNMWGGSSSRNQVLGTVYDEHSKEVTSVKGKWSDNLARQKDSENYQVLWEASEMPQKAEDYYGFTYFAMSLNETTKDIEKIIPITDTRLRPDQRAFEEGDVDTAESVKQKLETEQRSRRKELESSGKKYQPKWFHEEKGDGPDWKYGGKDGEEYFKKRDEAKNDSKAWGDLPKVFEY